jgi:yecA family protein
VSTDSYLLSIIEDVKKSGDTRPLSNFVYENRAKLLQDTKISAALLNAFTASPLDDDPVEAIALQGLIDEARMDVENDGQHGPVFLKDLSEYFASLENLSAKAAGIIATCYARANVEVPDALLDIRIREMNKVMENSTSTQGVPPTPGDIGDLLKTLSKEVDGDNYALFEGLRELMAGVPKDTRHALAYDLTSAEHSASWTMAGYWLLSPDQSLREAVAHALLEKAKTAAMDGVLARRLPMLRSWMPADMARSLLDQAIREVRRHNLPASPAKKSVKTLQILVTPPDGVGAQSLAFFATKSIAMVLTKAGHGIKDAYIIPCRENSPEATAIANQLDDIAAEEVSKESARTILAAALADGKTNDVPPAHGFIDIASLFGMEDLRPNLMTATDWLHVLDPEGMIGQMTTQLYGRRINQSVYLIDDYDFFDNWFDDTAKLREAFETAKNFDQQMKLAALHLDERREYWAKQMLQVAFLLKEVDEDWESLTINAHALLNARPVEKTALAQHIAFNSVQAFNHSSGGLYEESDMMELDTLTSDMLAEMLSEIGMPESDPAWLDGYLHAVIIAPKPIEPDDWLGGVIEQLPPPVDEAIIMDLINAIFALYNHIGGSLDAGETTTSLGTSSPSSTAAWARGFSSLLATTPTAWKARSVTKADKEFIVRINKVGTGETETIPAKELQTWIAKRFAK